MFYVNVNIMPFVLFNTAYLVKQINLNIKKVHFKGKYLAELWPPLENSSNLYFENYYKGLCY